MYELHIDSAQISKIGKNMLKTVYKDGAVINTNHLEKIREAYSSLHGNDDLSDLLLLVVFEGGIKVSHDAGDNYVLSRIRRKNGEAFVARHPQTLEYLNAAVAVMQSQHPVGIFDDEDEAIRWLIMQ